MKKFKNEITIEFFWSYRYHSIEEAKVLEALYWLLGNYARIYSKK